MLRGVRNRSVTSSRNRLGIRGNTRNRSGSRKVTGLYVQDSRIERLGEEVKATGNSVTETNTVHLTFRHNCVLLFNK